jgi:hypothetical protein
MTGNSTFDDYGAAIAAGKGQVTIVRKTVDAHKSDVMAVAGIFCPRIP